MSNVADTVDGELDKIAHLIKQQQVQYDELVSQLSDDQAHIAQAIQKYEQTLDKFKQEFRDLITEAEKPWFVESYRFYDQEMGNETVDDVRDRTLKNLPEGTKNFYLARISKYNSWKHTAMIIRPGFETYINEMVGCDPLYVIDTRHDLIDVALQQHNELYRQRLRPYVISEREDSEILAKLPNNQFGFVFVYNFFNFRPFEIIRRYLQEIYAKLHAGGVLIMTFNDCDRDKAVMLVEQNFSCYTPGYLVRDLAQSIGFEVILSWHDDGPSSWLELRKPGEFESLRGGQALAKILPKPIA